MKYRVEIDALNALIEEQRRTNELLEQLIKPQVVEAKTTPIPPKTAKRTYTRRKKQ